MTSQNSGNFSKIIIKREVNQMAREDLFLKDQLINTLRIKHVDLDKKYSSLGLKYDNLIRQEQKLNSEQ